VENFGNEICIKIEDYLRNKCGSQFAFTDCRLRKVTLLSYHSLNNLDKKETLIQWSKNNQGSEELERFVYE